MNNKLASERLKALRIKTGISHEKLAIALQEKYQIHITPASLKKYEVSEEYHSNYGAVKGMRSEYLYILADFYGVSADYILGRTNSISTNLKEQALYNQIGLSHKAIENLKELWNGRNMQTNDMLYNLKVFDDMLSDLNFMEKFSQHLLKYAEYDYEAQEMILKTFATNRGKNLLNQKSAENIDIKRGYQRYLLIHTVETFINEFSAKLLHIKHEIEQQKQLNTDINERWDLYGKENK